MSEGGRGVATIRVSAEMMARWVNGENRAQYCVSPLKDLVIVGACMGDYGRDVRITVSSPDLEPVGEGDNPPEYCPVFKVSD